MDNMQPFDKLLSEYVTDRGDETQRNFRYQHSYGVILLYAGSTNLKPYKAIWCEHHEDLLAQTNENFFEAFQIKTRQPELGGWVNNDDDIKKSIKRFVALHINFGVLITRFVFVSNTRCFDCGAEVKHDTLKKSPVKFLQAILEAERFDALKIPFLKVFEELTIYCGCTASELYHTLKRTVLIVSPSRESMDSEIVTRFLSKHPSCSGLPVPCLNSIRDEAIQAVYNASSMKIDDPYQYLFALDANVIDPRVIAKRVSIEVIDQAINNFKEIIFRYQPNDLTLKLDTNRRVFDVISQKFIRANMSDQIATMKRRTLSAESRLLELGTIDPQGFNDKMSQLESIVQAECDEASLFARFSTKDNQQVEQFGPLMLKDTIARLRSISESNPVKVHREPFESLVGIAGLLTENCSVWWSERFDLNTKQ
jgi:hypothetical protein